METPVVGISELIGLLDPETLSALSARLHLVASHHQPPVDAGQLLFEFIEENLAVHEEEMFDAIDPEEAKAKALAFIEEMELAGAEKAA